jgi:epsilon-lactone hydrolase
MTGTARPSNTPRWRTTAAVGFAMLFVGAGIATALMPSGSSGAHNLATWPLPNTLSSQGREVASQMANSRLANIPLPISLQRKIIDGVQNKIGGVFEKRYGVRVESSTIAGVPVRIIYPKGISNLATGPVLMNLHGGGFQLDSGSLTETIPIAALSGIPVVAVLYRLAPEHPYPAALDDALAVYTTLQKGRKSSQIAVFGTSAGAALSGQLTAKLIALGRPLPAAVGYFSGSADLSTSGDSESWQPLPGGAKTMAEGVSTYVGKTPVTDPVLSPLHGDISKFPPTLLVSSSRDVLLSPTAIFARALLEKGVDARFVVFDGLPHAFWAYMDIPETAQADALMAMYLRGKLVTNNRSQ